MNEENKYSNRPHIHQKGETDQKTWQSMMENIFIVIAFLSDEHMRHHSAQVLPKLANVEDFHPESCWEILAFHKEVFALACPSKPRWKVDCILEKHIGSNGTNKVVNQRIYPLDKCIGSFGFSFCILIPFQSDEWVFTLFIK